MSTLESNAGNQSEIRYLQPIAIDAKTTKNIAASKSME